MRSTLSNSNILINYFNSITGSTEPTLPNDGNLQLFSMKFCPYAHRAHLIFYAKQIPHHIIYINLNKKPEWFFRMNPLAKVPAIRVPEKGFLYESLIVSEYLDEQYPDSKILPTNSFDKSIDKIWIERFDGSVIQPMYKIFPSIFNNKDDPDALETFFKGLDIFEEELKKRGTTFFGGNSRPGYLDYMIWPWFERFGIFTVLGGDSYSMSQERFSRLVSEIYFFKDSYTRFYVLFDLLSFRINT